ncbi:uncharacterized protein [Struthio camelus]|uniref:uncharacterized protein isoform X1 n=1 Tax=Struthio camelus TaxID=8801 RepID=UPI003603C2FF
MQVPGGSPDIAPGRERAQRKQAEQYRRARSHRRRPACPRARPTCCPSSRHVRRTCRLRRAARATLSPGGHTNTAPEHSKPATDGHLQAQTSHAHRRAHKQSSGYGHSLLGINAWEAFCPLVLAVSALPRDRLAKALKAKPGRAGEKAVRWAPERQSRWGAKGLLEGSAPTSCCQLSFPWAWHRQSGPVPTHAFPLHPGPLLHSCTTQRRPTQCPPTSDGNFSARNSCHCTSPCPRAPLPSLCLHPLPTLPGSEAVAASSNIPLRLLFSETNAPSALGLSSYLLCSRSRPARGPLLRSRPCAELGSDELHSASGHA